jgi:hypothetical protein
MNSGGTRVTGEKSGTGPDIEGASVEGYKYGDHR